MRRSRPSLAAFTRLLVALCATIVRHRCWSARIYLDFGSIVDVHRALELRVLSLLQCLDILDVLRDDHFVVTR